MTQPNQIPTPSKNLPQTNKQQKREKKRSEINHIGTITVY